MSDVVSPGQYLLAVLSCLLTGLGTGWLGSEVLRLVQRPFAEASQSWQFEQRRRRRLYDGCRLFRWFGPLIDEIKDQRWLHALGRIGTVRRSLLQGGAELPWTAEEYLGMRAVRGLIAGLVAAALVGYARGGVAAAFVGLIVATATVWGGAGQLQRAAQRRIGRFQQRLPFAIDLAALMMEAGADLRQSLAAVVRENAGHPVGEEFDRLLQNLTAGQSLRESLEQLQHRLQIEEIQEIVCAVKNADELGTPLGPTFLRLADQMRLKRSQHAEKAAGRAQTMMTFPAIVIMVACLLVAVAPFILSAIEQNPFAD